MGKLFRFLPARLGPEVAAAEESRPVSSNPREGESIPEAPNLEALG